MEKRVAASIRRVCRPDAIETELKALWDELASDTPLVRPLMSNLVVVRTGPAIEGENVEAPLPAPLETVVERHPSRVIVLMHRQHPSRAEAPVAAAVAILVFGREPPRIAVEQITIHCVSSEASLPSIVRRLVLGDLPTAVWWTDDLSVRRPLEALVAVGRQFVYDSHQWQDVRTGLATVVGLASARVRPDLADLNWGRLAPLRRAIAHAIDRERPLSGTEAAGVRVIYASDHAAKGWLLAGWLAARLERLPRGAPSIEVRPADAGAGPWVSASIDLGGPATIVADIDETRAAVGPIGSIPAFSVRVPPDRIGEAVAGELLSLGRDDELEAAMREAHRLAQQRA